jgi:hypothetical protein
MRSVFVLKLYRIAYRFDIKAVIKFTVNKILNINLLFIMYIDLKSLYNCPIWLGTIQEKCLIINIIYLQQVYKWREITEVKWINSNMNPVDAIIKSKLCLALI